jgi:hypothetical protein
MESEQPSAPERPQPVPEPAAEHVADAHRRLKTLQARIGEHPELAEAITRLEMALSILTVKTSGLL